MSLPDALPLGIVHTSLAKRFPWPRFALLSQVPSHTGEREDGRRVDFIAIDLWARRGLFVAHLIDEKANAANTDEEARRPEKSAPFPCRYKWIACEAQKVPSIRAHVPTGWGLLSCGPGAATVKDEAEEQPVPPLDADVVRGLVQAAVRAALQAQPALRSKILPRKPPKSTRAAVTLLDVALRAIADAAPDQLPALEEALAARRAA
jgi:hypothetical protein